MAIGTSSGGIKAFYEILPDFSKNDAYAVLIVVHMNQKEVSDSFAKRLNEKCQLEVKSATHAMTIEPGTAYVIPGGFHAEVLKKGEEAIISLHEGPKVNFVRPSIDVLMKSVAEVFKENSIGILLTGMGMDGAQGMKAIKDAGGSTIAQNKTTSAVFSMPRHAIELDCVDKVLPLQEIRDETIKLVEEKVSQKAKAD
ncbi:chemotaxis protein CheB [archaeon]|nr:chemotaxis protein CheB [archaeon]